MIKVNLVLLVASSLLLCCSYQNSNSKIARGEQMWLIGDTICVVSIDTNLVNLDSLFDKEDMWLIKGGKYNYLMGLKYDGGAKDIGFFYTWEKSTDLFFYKKGDRIDTLDLGLYLIDLPILQLDSNTNNFRNPIVFCDLLKKIYPQIDRANKNIIVTMEIDTIYSRDNNYYERIILRNQKEIYFYGINEIEL